MGMVLHSTLNKKYIIIAFLLQAGADRCPAGDHEIPQLSPSVRQTYASINYMLIPI